MSDEMFPSDALNRNDVRAEFPLGHRVDTEDHVTLKYVYLEPGPGSVTPAAGQILYQSIEERTYGGGTRVTYYPDDSITGTSLPVAGVTTCPVTEGHYTFMQTWALVMDLALDPTRVNPVYTGDELAGSGDGTACGRDERPDISGMSIGVAVADEDGDTVPVFMRMDR